MTVRVEVVTPCPKCEGLGTRYDPFQLECSFCNGSGDEDRRSFTGWPPEAIEAAADAIVAHNLDTRIGVFNSRRIAYEALAAALGHITGDNK